MSRQPLDEVPMWVHEYWTPERREKQHHELVEREERELAEGKITDEHTIYNVLCPQIRAEWSEAVEQERRVGPTNRRLPFEFATPQAVLRGS